MENKYSIKILPEATFTGVKEITEIKKDLKIITDNQNTLFKMLEEILKKTNGK